MKEGDLAKSEEDRDSHGGSTAMIQAVFLRRQASHGRLLRLLRSRGTPKVLCITNLRGRP